MKSIGLDLELLYGKKVIEMLDSSLTSSDHKFFNNFKHIWADNGDMISKHYSGTGSTHTSANRKEYYNLLYLFYMKNLF